MIIKDEPTIQNLMDYIALVEGRLREMPWAGDREEWVRFKKDLEKFLKEKQDGKN